MDLTSSAADGVQAMVDTVEVVSTGEQVIEQQEETPNVNISVVNNHNGAPITSSGVSCPPFIVAATPILLCTADRIHCSVTQMNSCMFTK